MPDEPALREKVREAIRNGRLPRTRPDRRFGAPGSGEPCALCGDATISISGASPRGSSSAPRPSRRPRGGSPRGWPARSHGEPSSQAVRVSWRVVHVAVRVCYRDFSVPERALDHHVVVEGHERNASVAANATCRALDLSTHAPPPRPSVLPRIIVRERCVLKTTKAPPQSCEARALTKRANRP